MVCWGKLIIKYDGFDTNNVGTLFVWSKGNGGKFWFVDESFGTLKLVLVYRCTRV